MITVSGSYALQVELLTSLYSILTLGFRSELMTVASVGAEGN